MIFIISCALILGLWCAIGLGAAWVFGKIADATLKDGPAE